MALVQRKTFNIFILIVMIVITIVLLFPFFWLASNSLKDNKQIFTKPPTLLPQPAHWSNYPEAIQFIPLLTYFKNSILVITGASLGVVFFASFVAYGFTKIQWRGRDKLFIFVLATLMIPFHTLMIPLFILFTKLHLTTTLLPLIIPRFFEAFYIFLVRQFMVSISDDLIDAAKIDGCNHLGIYFRIMMPLLTPILFTVALLEIIQRWHDFVEPLVFLRDEKLYTLAVGLFNYMGLYHTEWALMLAACTMFTIPMIVIFLFFQRHFIEGMSTSGLKM